MSSDNGRLVAAARARDAEDWAAARRLYAEALTADPHSAEIILELAICALRTADAAYAMRLAKSVSDPKFTARAAIVRGKIRHLAGHYDDAASEFESALSDPRLPKKVKLPSIALLADLTLNQFGDADRAAALLNLEKGADPERASEASLIAKMYSGKLRGGALASAFTHHAQQYIDARSVLPQVASTKKARRRRTRIGLLSPSFFATPVGFLTLGTLQALSKHAHLVFFDRRPKKDWLSEKLRAIATEWHDVSACDAVTLASRIQREDLDSIIDCGGWTDVQALKALSMRPCRRQFKWVGGQALTTGLSCFDGFLSDARQVPKSHERFYIEPINRFSISYVTYSPPPYFDFSDAQRQAQKYQPKAKDRSFALVSNPAKISEETLTFIKSLRPKKLWLIDSRWRFERTRKRLLSVLEKCADNVEVVVPSGHRSYLETLRDLPAQFIDTRPYSMGLTAIELLLIGKPIVSPRRRAGTLMYERHSFGHQNTTRFDHYSIHATELLDWCSK